MPLHSEHLFLLAAIVTAVGVMIRGVVVPIHRMMRGLVDFLDEWQGRPAGPGRPVVPSLLERIDRIDREVRTNDGSSLKDAVNRIEARIERLEEDRVIRHDRGDVE